MLPAMSRDRDLIELTDNNEIAVAHQSLDAPLRHWYDARTLLAREWIEEIYQEVYPKAKERGFACFLSPIQKILREGNTAQQWLKQIENGMDSRQVIIQAIQDMAQLERELEDKLCQPLVT